MREKWIKRLERLMDALALLLFILIVIAAIALEIMMLNKLCVLPC